MITWIMRHIIKNKTLRKINWYWSIELVKERQNKPTGYLNWQCHGIKQNKKRRQININLQIDAYEKITNIKQNKNDEKTNYVQKTKEWATGTPSKTGGDLRCSCRASRSFSPFFSCRIKWIYYTHVIKNLVCC